MVGWAVLGLVLVGGCNGCCSLVSLPTVARGVGVLGGFLGLGWFWVGPWVAGSGSGWFLVSSIFLMVCWALFGLVQLGCFLGCCCFLVFVVGVVVVGCGSTWVWP